MESVHSQPSYFAIDERDVVSCSNEWIEKAAPEKRAEPYRLPKIVGTSGAYQEPDPERSASQAQMGNGHQEMLAATHDRAAAGQLWARRYPGGAVSSGCQRKKNLALLSSKRLQKRQF